MGMQKPESLIDCSGFGVVGTLQPPSGLEKAHFPHDPLISAKLIATNLSRLLIGCRPSVVKSLSGCLQYASLCTPSIVAL